jgi:hypothetical protein
LKAYFARPRDGKTPESRANIIRTQLKWLEEYAQIDIPDHDSKVRIKKVYALIGEITRCLAKNPTGECKMPYTPKIEGQW